MKEVVELLVVNCASVSSFIKERLLSSRNMRIGNSTITVVSTEAVEAFKSTYVLATEIASSLRTSSKFLIGCMERNGVQPICGRRTGRKVHYVYKRSDVERLNISAIISEAKAGKVMRRDLGDDRVISLEEASRLLNTNVVSLRRLVRRKIVKPYSEIISHNTERPYYLFRLRIIEEIRSAAVNCTVLLTTSEAAKIMGESDGWFIMKWAHTKRVRAIKFKHARDRYFFLRPEINALAHFKKKTIPSKTAAKILGVNPVTLYKWTLSGMLKLASGPSIDGFGNHLYLRKDIERFHKKRDRKTRHIVSAA